MILRWRMMLWGAMLSTAIQKDALLIAQNGEVKNATEMSARISPPVKSSYKNQRYEWDALISQVHANKSSSQQRNLARLRFLPFFFRTNG